jgi:hypothetical protein
MKAQRNLNTKTTNQNNGMLTGSFTGWFLALCIFFLPNLTKAQLTYSHWLQFRQFHAFALQNPALPKFIYNHKATNYVRHFETDSVSAFSSLSKTPRYAEYNELGWFCTLDLKMDLKMKMPMRFRLGTLEEVNRKEGYR